MSVTDQTSARKCLPLPPPEPFDYCAMAPEHVADLRQHAARIRERTRITTATIIEIGKELLAAKQHLHGQFEDWIMAECGFTVRTAENYMRAAKLAEGKSETVSFLPPGIVYRLAAKSTPPELVDQVIERVAAGKVVTNDAVKAVLADAAYHRRQTARKDREAARRSAATRKRKEAQERERLEQMERERQAAHEVKQQLIDRFGIDGVRFFLNALARDKYWAVRPLLEEAVKQHDLDRVVDPVAVEQKGAS
jgi:hypothetical protein